VPCSMKTRAYRRCDVQEVGGDDAVGLGGEEMAPGWAAALRSVVDYGGVEDLADGGWGDRVAKAGGRASPCIRRWPQLLFSEARRRMSSLTEGVAEGLPGRRCPTPQPTRPSPPTPRLRPTPASHYC
jgi:hypothetical protein